MQRNASILLIAAFSAVIATPALVQTTTELARGQWPQSWQLWTETPTADNLRAYETQLEDASLVAATLRPWAQSVLFHLCGDLGQQVIVGEKGWLFYGPGIESLTQRASVDTPIDGDPLSAIVSFRDQLQQRGIHLLVVPVPNKESIYPERLTRRGEGSGVICSRPTRELIDHLRAADVNVVDLFDVFARAKRKQTGAESTQLYLAQDTHWSPAGAAIAAQWVASSLMDRGWIQPGEFSYHRESVTLRHQGDLLRMLRAASIEQTLGSETINCTQILSQTDGTLYEDDSLAEILVVGDSFLKIYQQNEPGAAGFIAHLAAQLGRPVASLVNEGGASTLVRQQLARQPELLDRKKVVVWEFVERDIRQGTDGWREVSFGRRENAERYSPQSHGDRQVDAEVQRLAEEVRDKGWIVFSARSRRGDWDLFLCRPDGSHLRNFTQTPQYGETAPLLSRDGSRLLYRRLPAAERLDNNRHGTQGQLVVANSDGSSPRVLGGPAEYSWASWSPDGKQIACLSIRGVFFVDLDRLEVVRRWPRQGFFQQLVWSPDGKWLAGVSNSFGASWSVARMNATTGETNAVSRVDCCTPDWLPDSRSVIFSRRPTGQETNEGYGWTQLWVANAEGESRRLIYGEDGRHIYGGHVSPDGNYVLFASGVREDGDPGNAGAPIRLMRLADAPIVGGDSPKLHKQYPQARGGPVVDVCRGWEPCWTYADIGGEP